MNNQFCEMSLDEALVIDGGGIVSDVVNGVAGIWKYRFGIVGVLM